MANKLCIDIGGTKTIFATLNHPNSILKSTRIDTPQTRSEFLKIFKETIPKFLENEEERINVSIAGRIDGNGRVVFAPNLPIKGVNLRDFFRKFSNRVLIDNDANCFTISRIHNDEFKWYQNGLVVVWGTGLGGAIVYKNKIYRGGGFASEIGHHVSDFKTGRDVESEIGGRSIERIYGISGYDMHRLAERGDRRAIKIFEEIGRKFGYYLLSMSYILDPNVIIIGGSFINSWKFMKSETTKMLKKGIRKKIRINIDKGKFYVVKGCYFLDEYEDVYN